MSADDASGAGGSRSTDAAGTVATRGINYALGFVASVIIARALGPDGRGAYYVIVTIASTAISVGHLSVEQANLYLWANRPGRRSQLVGGSLLIGAVAGALAAVVAAGVVLGLGGEVIPVASLGLLAVALVAVPGGMTATYLNGLLVTGGWLWKMNQGALLAAGVQTAAVVVLGLAGELTVAAVIVVWAVITALPLVVQIPALARRSGLTRPDRSLVGETVALGLRYHLGMIAIFLVLRVDIFMLNAMTTTERVGLYSLAVTLTEAALLVTDSVAQAAVVGQIADPDDDDDRHTYTARVARTNLVLAVGLVGLLAATGPVLIPLVFGSPFGPSVGPVLALAAGIVALAFRRPLGVYIVQLNRPWLVSAASGVALVVNVGVNLVLIPRMGIVGAGIASTITYAGLAAFYAAWFLRASAATVGDLVPRVDDVTEPAGAVIRDLRGFLRR